MKSEVIVRPILKPKAGGLWDEQKVARVIGSELYKAIIIPHE